MGPAEPDRADRLLAEAYAAGAVGSEEETDGSGTRWLLYVPAADARAVREALAAAGGADVTGAEEPVPEHDWVRAWREGLGPVVVSPRLVVRPSSVEHMAAPGQATVLIEPGQAFGTGEHESTRLALELLDAVLPGHGPGARVLDVGTGSGVLAIAALKLGAKTAVGFDLDPVAVAAAGENARANGVGPRLRLFTGGIEGLASGTFELVVANLLRRELEPVLAAIAARVSPGGGAVFAGLLAAERERVGERLASVGLTVASERTRVDASGESWLGLYARRR